MKHICKYIIFSLLFTSCIYIDKNWDDDPCDTTNCIVIKKQEYEYFDMIDNVMRKEYDVLIENLKTNEHRFISDYHLYLNCNEGDTIYLLKFNKPFNHSKYITKKYDK